jgi:hypothetical protein
VNAVFDRVRRAYEVTLGVVLKGCVDGGDRGGAHRAFGAVVVHAMSQARSWRRRRTRGSSSRSCRPRRTRRSATRSGGLRRHADAFLSVPEAKIFFQVAEMAMGGGFGGIQVDWHDRDRTTEDDPAGGDRQADADRGAAIAVAVLPAPLPGAGQFDVELVVTSGAEAPEMEPIINQIIGAGFGSGSSCLRGLGPEDRPAADEDRDRSQEGCRPGLDLADVGRDLSVLLSGRVRQPVQLRGPLVQGDPAGGGRSASRTPEQVLQWKVRTRDGGSVTLRRW